MNSPIRNKVLRTAVNFVFILHILVLIKFILLKDPAELSAHFKENYSVELVQQNISEGNYIPFYTFNFYVTGTDKTRYSKENLVGNIVLFFPMGILLPLLFHKVRSFKKIGVISFAISLGLELAQLFGILGNFDVDDLLLNVLGAWLGFGSYLLVKELIMPQSTQISE